MLSPGRKTMKDYEQQQKHLEQENFQMKVRIYMLEERLQGNSTPDTDNNMIVDLKVGHRRPAARWCLCSQNVRVPGWRIVCF